MNEDIEVIDFAENTDFLISELKKEWQKSKETKASIAISRQAARELLWMITGRGIFIGKEAQSSNLSFKEDMLATKECHIYLRLAEKLERALSQHAKDRGSVGINMDSEEYECLYPLLKARGEGICDCEV